MTDAFESGIRMDLVRNKPSFMDEMEKSCICGSVAVTLPLFSAGKEEDENIRGAGC